ncbi:MAG: ABC transporter ATP-binding protein [Planctomycetales bacterium]|nr:ABC transporter ATP-binding protein [Planctomycetales bacterium]
MLELDRLTRLYGPVIGVNDVSLSLPRGAYGLLGPNGAGKSTLLNLITGQLRPTLGSVQVLGHVPRNNPEYLAHVGYLPGSEGMYANVSARDWVTYLAELQGAARRVALERAERALEQVGMTQHMHRPISDYSRGLRQRTRIAQAIAHEPEFLILDEPFSGLDPIARHDIAVLLRQWIADGRSLIIASHVLHEIESITRSFLLISGGRLLASGSADEIHQLLADAPTETTVRTEDPHRLGAALTSQGLIDSLQIYGADRLRISSRTPREMFAYLATASAEGMTITEMHAEDESLHDVFQALMRRQRGIR